MERLNTGHDKLHRSRIFTLLTNYGRKKLQYLQSTKQIDLSGPTDCCQMCKSRTQ